MNGLKPIPQKQKAPAGYGVFDDVADEGLALFFFEGVFMVPAAVGASELNVREEMRRLPTGDFAFPTNGNAVDLDFVLNARAKPHGNWFGREDLNLEKRRCELFEIFGVSEERKNFGQRAWGAKFQN